MGAAASCPKQPGPRNRTDNRCVEMLSDGSFHMNFVGRPKKPKPLISPYFRSWQDRAREEAAQGLHSFRSVRQKMPPKEDQCYG